MKIYIGEFEGNHWAVESEREKPKFHPSDFPKESNEVHAQWYKEWDSYNAYLSSLPRTYQCSDSLVRGLKVGDVLPECREQYQRKIDAKWVDCSEDVFKVLNKYWDNECRIMLVPVEAKQEQERLYECENCGWSGTDVKTIRLEDRCPKCNSLEISTYGDYTPKPQSQGEDELWERAWEESCKYEYYDPEDDRFLKTKFFDYLKSKYTITRKG